MKYYDGFNALHPFVGLIYYVGVFVLSMIFLHPYFLLSALTAVILLNIFHDRARKLQKGLFFFLFLSFVILVINPLFSHRGATILFYFLDQPITLESIMYGLMMMLSILVLLIAFISFNFIISEDKFIFLFSSFAPRTALLIMMSFRFVPLLKRRLTEISLIQETRGISVRTGNLKQRANAGMNILHILLAWSLEEALQTADSMKARGYGVGKRSSFFTYRFHRRDIIYLTWFVFLSVTLVSAGVLGFGTLEIYPQLESLKLSRSEQYIFGVFLVFIFTPHLIEGRERLRWLY
ncbi:energy-coupling factor transporter transmembrane component T [Bacillus sp. Marseille-P3661]|uniref:energy-coupling factor transporter transmembrane component T n=1 Tax=Bacillus sp. Marseille-P3661 TaxID=1936234 RepID=UPI000C824D9C|nr:energy-coupling factor transporter transmembrane component T [Bacillus sp. Marseille-P3661]